MTLKQLVEGIPLDYYQEKSIKDINARISVSRGYLTQNFTALTKLAASMGGTWDKNQRRFRVHIEYNPATGETKLAEIRITDFITERNIIKRPGMEYYSDFAREWAENQINRV